MFDHLTRIEKGLENSDANHRQWVEQIATSLREVTTRKPD